MNASAEVAAVAALLRRRRRQLGAGHGEAARQGSHGAEEPHAEQNGLQRLLCRQADEAHVV